VSALPIVIDVEASGFGRGGYPIEIGLAMPDDRTHCFLVRPAPSWTHWDPAAEAVHHIRRDILVSRGRPVTEVAESLNAILDGRTVYSDAWGHDSSWVALLFEEADRPQRFRVEALRGLLSDSELADWHARRGQVERSLGALRHRASVDALVIQRTFVACRATANTAFPGA
jgi:hypothetical protein